MRAAIYYPYMNPPSSWLKQALLYWDHVCTIVNDRFWDSAHVDLLWLSERGIFEPLRIDDLSERGQNDLRKEVTKLANVAKRQGFKVPTDESQLDFFYQGKLPRSIEEELKSRSLIGQDPKGNLITHRELLCCILDLAAKCLSRELTQADRHYSVHADQPEHARLAFSPIQGDGSEPELAIQVILRNMLPIPGELVSLEDILDFKERHKTELLHFRTSLDSVTSELRSRLNGNPAAVAGVRDEFELALRELESSYRRRRISYALASLSILAGAATGHYAPHDLENAISWEYSGAAGAWMGARFQRIRDIPHFGNFSYLYRALRHYQ